MRAARRIANRQGRFSGYHPLKPDKLPSAVF
jgi:hypothetical protein